MKLCTNSMIMVFLVGAAHFPSLAQSSDVARRAELELFAGAAFPVGDFSGNVVNQLGHATTGFGAGVEYVYHVIEFLDLGILAGVNYNSFDAAKLAEESGAGITASATQYLNISTLGSIGFNVPTTQTIRFHAQGCLGIVKSISPDITLTAGSSKATITSASSYAFAYSFGAGLSILPIDISVRYLFAEPEYEFMDAVGMKVKVKQPVGLVQLSLGYVLAL